MAASRTNMIHIQPRDKVVVIVQSSLLTYGEENVDHMMGDLKANSQIYLSTDTR